METTEAEKDNKEKVVMDIMAVAKAVDIMAVMEKAMAIMAEKKAIMVVVAKAVAIMVAEKAIMVVMEKAVDIMMVEKAVAIMAVKATMVASDSIIAHPIAIGTT